MATATSEVEHAVSARSDQADAGVVLRRPDDPSRRGADLLLVDVAVSRDVAGAFLARTPRPVPKYLQRDHRLPARRRPAIGSRAVGQLPARGPPAQGNGVDGVGDERAAHALRHHRSARGSAACAERRVRARCRRSQLPPAEVDRHRLHVRAHGVGPGELDHAVPRRRVSHPTFSDSSGSVRPRQTCGTWSGGRGRSRSQR